MLRLSCRRRERGQDCRHSRPQNDHSGTQLARSAFWLGSIGTMRAPSDQFGITRMRSRPIPCARRTAAMASPTTTLVFAERSDQLRKGRKILKAKRPRPPPILSASATSGKISCSQFTRCAPFSQAMGAITTERRGGSVLATMMSPARASRHKRQPAAR